MKTLVVISLVVLPIWWIFRILWTPGFVHQIANVSYRFSPLSISSSTPTLARERALLYATRGGSTSDDIYFTKDEVSHLIDVSKLYKPISLSINILSVVGWSILILALAKQEELKSAFYLSSNILGGLTVSLLICIALFPVFFDLFHKALFPQGNWSFPVDSLLIQIFPESFWKLMLLAIILMLGASSGLFYLLSKPAPKS